MGLWRWLFGPSARGVVAGDLKFEMHVVGTSHYQDALKNICGDRTSESAHHYCAALLAPQPRNPYSRHAVVVTIDGYEVGHLEHGADRDFLQALRKEGFADAACEAEIVGGWDRGGDHTGYFGIRLNATLPFNLYPAKEWHRGHIQERPGRRS
jgi:hypothetical protein